VKKENYKRNFSGPKTIYVRGGGNKISAPPPPRSFKETTVNFTLSFLLHTPYRPTPYLDKQQGVGHCVRIKY
jgi:hypothetical protein